MSEASDLSDVSRSARAYTSSAPGSTSRRATVDDRKPSPTHMGAVGMSSSNATSGEHEQQQHDDSFADERYTLPQSLPMNSSWEGSQSFDEGEERCRPSSRPSSRTSLRDRRKQFDTTTPTLIDEEDDSEMISLEHARLHHSAFGERDDSLIRRTPGATMYKSSFEPTPEEAADRRKAPRASSMQRSAVQMPQSLHLSSQQISSADEKEPVGLGFGLTLSTPVGAMDPQAPPGRDRQRHIVWETSYRDQSLSSSGTASAISSRQSDMAADLETNRPSARPLSGVAPISSLGSGQRQEPRGLFSFGTWAKSTREEQTQQQLSHGSGEGRASGAFSPNILRLTEDIGNLLHEDEDDDFALILPSVGRGDQLSDVGATNEDWTGSYVFDSEAGRRASKPAVPSRSSNIGNNPVAPKEGKSRRRTSNASNTQQQQYMSSAFLPNAQQPKPRMRSGNEVFEFGKSSHAESSQVLNFGGAFAPPSFLMGNNQGLMRPAISSSFQGGASQSEASLSLSGRGQQQHLVHHQYHTPGLLQGNFQVGISSNNNAGGPLHTSLDSYQLQGNVASGFSGGYFQSQSVYNPGVVGPAYRMSSVSPYNQQQQSEMQATAREFVPRTTFSTSQYGVQQPWQPELLPSTMSPYEAQIEQTTWPDTSTSYGYSGNYGYGTMPPPTSLEPRSSITPSPHLPAWQPPAQSSHPPQPQQQPQQHPHQKVQQQQPVQTPPPVIDPNLVYSSAGSNHRSAESVTHHSNQAHRTVSSPHPSIAGSEHSQSTSQLSKKESKRKQRRKKKTPKSDSPGPGKKILPISKRKPGKGDPPARPSSTPHSNDGQEEAQVSASEDPNDAKKSELIESPATRAAFKEFYRTIRSEERISFQKAEEFALQSLSDGSLPESVHWRVYLELADLAKRSNRYVEARRLYKMVCQLQPYASQGWLEYSKLEEECGHMNRVMNILHSGLEYCKYSESLLTRAVKHQEKMGNLASARELLARLKHVGIEKVWRTVLEGALLEARAGNVATARRVLKYLMHHVPWYGPLYLEAYRVEKDQGHPLDALQIVERGLQAIPRYGPLWFGAFRLCEEMDRSKKQFDLTQTMEMIERATVCISKELVWKVHLEAAQMLERSALEQGNVEDPSFDELLVPARRRMSMTILTCPNNLRWKVWLAAARMELGVGNTERARSLFSRAHEVVPKKGRSSTLLESARLEDFIGDTELARAVLCKGRFVYGYDWKVWLESVLLEMRSGNHARAIEICINALEIHHGTGRLWATLVQLRQFNGRDEAQRVALRRALNAVPKSGEVWCEGGRIHLNPFSDTFDLRRARRHLFFATRFTPQYGDGFVETIRLELIDQWLAPIASYIWEKTKSSFQPSMDARVESSLTKYITDVALAISVASLKDNNDKEMSKTSLPKLVHRNIVPTVRKKLKPEVLRDAINLSDLRLACVNADPNYGLLWFHCRRRPTDTPRRIIEDAAGDIASELQKYAHIYLAALIRRQAILSTVEAEKPPNLEEGLEINDAETAKWNDYLDEKLQASPSLEEIFNPIDPTTGLELLENTVNGPLFVTGLSELNKHKPMSSLPLAERRRSLFGNDALFP